MHRALRHVLVASAIGASLLAMGTWLSGCVIETSGGGYGYGGGCTAIGGFHGITLRVRPSGAGHYDIVVRSSVIEAQCSFEVLPEGTYIPVDCISRQGTAMVQGYESGVFLISLMTDSVDISPPASLELRVYDASRTEILRRDITPSYTTSYPNGIECDARGYMQASETIVLPSSSDGDAGPTPRFDAGTDDAGTDAGGDAASDDASIAP